MSTLTIDQQVVKIVAEQLGVPVGDIHPETSVVDDLGADSLDAIELVMALEEEFSCEISDADAEQVHTVADMIALVKKSSGVMV